MRKTVIAIVSSVALAGCSIIDSPDRTASEQLGDGIVFSVAAGVIACGIAKIC